MEERRLSFLFNFFFEETLGTVKIKGVIVRFAFDDVKLHFSMINVKTTLLKLWRYYVKYRVLKHHFL